MRSNFNVDGLGAFGIIVGLAGLIFAGWQAKKTNDITKKLGAAMDEVEKKTPVDISNDIIDKAVQSAADREVRNAVYDTVKSVKNTINKEVETEVRKEVISSVNKISDATSEEISKQVAMIDEGALRTKVIEKAEEKILKKFDGSLDNVLNEAREECRQKMNSVFKSWESIADWASTLLPRRNSNGNGFNFHID